MGSPGLGPQRRALSCKSNRRANVPRAQRRRLTRPRVAPPRHPRCTPATPRPRRGRARARAGRHASCSGRYHARRAHPSSRLARSRRRLRARPHRHLAPHARAASRCGSARSDATPLVALTFASSCTLLGFLGGRLALARARLRADARDDPPPAGGARRLRSAPPSRTRSSPRSAGSRRASRTRCATRSA